MRPLFDYDDPDAMSLPPDTMRTGMKPKRTPEEQQFLANLEKLEGQALTETPMPSSFHAPLPKDHGSSAQLR